MDILATGYFLVGRDAFRPDEARRAWAASIVFIG